MRNASRLIWGLLFTFVLAHAYAGTQPKFSILPIFKPPAEITTADTVDAVYLVTNNTLLQRWLTMVPIAGVTQNTNPPGACQSPFLLNSGQSCVLVLSIEGSQIGSGISAGPIICKTLITDNQTPDRFLCSQPSLSDTLKVKVV